MDMHSDELSVRMLMFDVECARIRCSLNSPLFSNIKDKQKKQLKDMENYAKLESFENLARQSDSMKAIIIDSTFDKAYEMLSPNLNSLKDALTEFDDKVDEEMESWSKDLVVKLILEEKRADDEECDSDTPEQRNKKMVLETIKTIGKVAICVHEMKAGRHR